VAAGFCPKKLHFARKMMTLPEPGGLQTPQPVPWLVRTPGGDLEVSLNASQNLLELIIAVSNLVVD